MAADTSSPAAAISRVVETAAAALAALIAAPRPATSVAAAVKVSRAAITPDMSSPYPGQPSIQIQAQLRCPIRGLR
ncbi:hypothetical protein MMMB2_5091 [Mycobacterium marinum MB2]|nr:hypothetical protein MMMB2_5091 [Mycobacterium marinum MB2]